MPLEDFQGQLLKSPKLENSQSTGVVQDSSSQGKADVAGSEKPAESDEGPLLDGVSNSQTTKVNCIAYISQQFIHIATIFLAMIR